MMSKGPKIIAVAGKGGVGKTTLSALLIRALVLSGATPILAVDADPNTNLAEALGEEPGATIGSVLASFMDNRLSIPMSMTKEAYLEIKLNEALHESKAVDFVVMGRKQGGGCYCYPNALLKKYIEQLAGNYKFIVVDNEAGMEHLSRKTLDAIDIMLLVSDHSVKGLRAVKRISELVGELALDVKEKVLIVNRFREADAETLAPNVEAAGVSKVFIVPEDPDVTSADALQKNFMELPEDMAAVKALSAVVKHILEK